MEEMIREWMARKRETNKDMKNQLDELENQINQGSMNHQAIIKNLERKFKFLDKKIMRTESLPRTQNTKPIHEIVYKPPLVRNEKDKGDVEVVDEDQTKPIPTLPNPNLIKSNSPTALPFLKDCVVHILYTQGITKEKVFEKDVLSNNVGEEELKSNISVGTGNITKKDEMGLPNEPNKEWKLNEKAIPQKENVYH
nr:hypothetical protein [Tanacetum cinerariifolium]